MHLIQRRSCTDTRRLRFHFHTTGRPVVCTVRPLRRDLRILTHPNGGVGTQTAGELSPSRSPTRFRLTWQIGDHRIATAHPSLTSDLHTPEPSARRETPLQIRSSCHCGPPRRGGAHPSARRVITNVKLPRITKKNCTLGSFPAGPSGGRISAGSSLELDSKCQPRNAAEVGAIRALYGAGALRRPAQVARWLAPRPTPTLRP